jgi:predicted RNA-binding protein with PIN domain
MTLTIVDAMNVIGSRPQTRWWRERDQAMRNLIEDLADWGEAQCAAGHDVLVVFDGYPISGLEDARLPYIFAERPGPDGADDEIVEIVEDDEEPETIVVITSDAGLRSRLASSGARVDGVSTLLRQIPR